MYCGKCGKRVYDDMSFCPFCGAPIVIPEQDEPVSPPNPKPESPVLIDPVPTSEEPPQVPEEEFVPLRFNFDEPDESPDEPETPSPEVAEPSSQPEPEVSAPSSQTEPEASEPVSQSEPELVVPSFQPSRPEREQPRRSGQPPRRSSRNTYVPLRNVDPNNLFMNDSDTDDEDDFDSDNFDEDSFDFEEKDRRGFLHRHARGLVALILLIVVLLLGAAWAFSGSGQYTLAKLNLAWKADPYARLGYEAYNAQDYTLAAKNYSHAASLAGNNYEYAHSAMVAEYMADDLAAATVMAKKCVELNPDSVEPYLELKKIYTNKDLPWDVRELLKQGYERTGDAQLNVG